MQCSKFGFWNKISQIVIFLQKRFHPIVYIAAAQSRFLDLLQQKQVSRNFNVTEQIFRFKSALHTKGYIVSNLSVSGCVSQNCKNLLRFAFKTSFFYDLMKYFQYGKVLLKYPIKLLTFEVQCSKIKCEFKKDFDPIVPYAHC